jgi:hypothetical protein
VKGGPAAPGPGTSSSGGPSPLTGGLDRIDFSAWSWWWELNKEPYLDVKAHLYESGPSTNVPGFYLGRGVGDKHETASGRPTKQHVEQVVLPALLRALAGAEADTPWPLRA